MSTKVENNSTNELFGMFMEACEDVALEGFNEDNEMEGFSSYRYVNREKKTVFGKIFRAMEKVNLPMVESTDSLSSSLSNSSFRSSQSDLLSVSRNNSGIFTPEMFLDAVQSLTLNNYGSTNSLAGLDQQVMVPIDNLNLNLNNNTHSRNAVQFFFRALEEFINKSSEEEDAVAAEFPKFC